MKKVWSITLAVLALTMVTGVTAAQAPNRDARVTLNVVERELDAVVQYLRERSGANIVIVDPENKGFATAPVTLQVSDVSWRTALDLAAEKVGCVVEERRDGILVVTQPPRVTFEFPNEDIRNVVDLIGKTAGANIVMGPEVEGTVSVRFNGVPWRDALDVVAKARGYVVVEERGGVLRVVDPLKLQDQLITRSYQFRYLRPRGDFVPVISSEFVEGGPRAPKGEPAEHFAALKALRAALSPAGALDYVESQNVVIVRDTQQVHEQIREILTRLDVEPAQVFVDVKFVTTGNTDVLNLGVDYGDSGPTVSLSGGQIPITFPFDQAGGGFEDWFIASESGKGPFVNPDLNGGPTIVPETVFGALSFTQVQATLRLLQRDVTTEVFQAPKIIALDDHPATIFVGETIRYAEAKSEQGQAGGLQLSVSEAGASPVEVGFQLMIKPHIVPGDDKIIMEVIPKETSLSGTGNSSIAPPGFDVFTIGAAGLEGSIALPRTRSSTLVTTLMLENGQTAVIGGLTTETDTRTEQRVPGLSRIPLLGRLFRYEAKNRDRRSLLVFLTPSIVHSSEDQELLLQRELQRRRSALRDELEGLVRGGSPAVEPAAD